MIRNRLKCLGAAAAVVGMVCSMTTMAMADDFSVTNSADVAVMAPSATGVIHVELEAADDPNWGGDHNNLCNLRANPDSGAHNVFASITSSNEDVATVEPAEIEFTDCGVPADVTISSHTCNGTAYITIALDTSKSPAPSHVEFNDEIISVTVNGGTNCDGGGGGGITTCAQPAAPAWAAAIMTKNKVKPGSATWKSLMTATAHGMLKGAAFPNPDAAHPAFKSDQDTYANAVRKFLEASLNPTKVDFPYGPLQSARPGWDCTTTPPSA